MKAMFVALVVLAGLAVAVMYLWPAKWIAPPSAPAASAMPAPSSAARDALQATPQAQVHRDRQRFEADAKDFFARAPSLRAVERSERADALTRQIDRYEAEGGLSAGEAVLLRTALVQATIEDPARQAEEVAAIADRYRTHADQRMAAFAAQQANDPHFQSYKAREAQVVAEVMAMTSIPAGLTRDQYLRQRLQEERERAYAP
ncbi:hypothetical protein [Pseudoxanthomonas sp. PXM02]|uniref:hypothetical protein n=1 Tax=Pseudoxanthomonas sp. PXM02 TaxID=2769294 RepID=UPI00177D6AD7|nr:hypothetical protein [Pseudoxanthomonas sp. PXM02]MBD9477817.1 hypothetical protein [Pseudoxanthomonas sp. PXM02]